MSQLQQMIQQQQTSAPLVNVQDMQFWLDKAVVWGQGDRLDTQKDTCLHLSKLKAFLQELHAHIINMVYHPRPEACYVLCSVLCISHQSHYGGNYVMAKTQEMESSTSETMSRLPFLGQFLGRLCWNSSITADDTSRRLLLQCLWGLYSEHPSNPVERNANQWIRKVLCQLATEEGDAAVQELMKHIGIPRKEYHLKVLRKMVALLQKSIENSCSSLGNINERCSCEHILATSEACAPLVTCPEAAPLIGALLQQPATCGKSVLSEYFLDTLSSAYSSEGLLLEEEAILCLWYHSLSSLEDAVVSLLESVLMDTVSTQQKLEQQVAQSMLPKACAQHFSIFLVANDIFRSVLKQAEGNETVKSLIQTFTSCFLKELTVLRPQKHVSLKTFFPQSPQSLLVPLLTLPSEMPREAWRHHMNWLSISLQRLIEEEEEGDGDSSSNTRGHNKIFEAWFLLVQCAYWMQVTVQLLVISGPEDCDLLLWLLTFYHHPTNRGHHRALQLIRAKEAWDHLRPLFMDLAGPLPVNHLQSLVTLLSPQQHQQSLLSSKLILNLLVNFVVFCQQSLKRSTQILQTVVDQTSLVDEAVCILHSLGLRLNEESCLSSDGNRVHLRLKALQNTLTHKHGA